MTFSWVSFITNPLVLMMLAIFTGLWVGKVSLGNFRLGVSGALFTGLIIGWWVYRSYALPYVDAAEMPAYAQAILTQGMVPKLLFTFSLVLFVAAVGLLASKDLGFILKKYGVRFVILGALITFTGAAVCYIFTLLSTGQSPFAISGVYTGALTSSPGLGAALEAVSVYGEEAAGLVASGYALAYAPGVLSVILAVHFLPVIFGIDVAKEREQFKQELTEGQDDSRYVEEVGFDLTAFITACLLGFALGQVKLYLGSTIGYFSLGATGGVLVASLALGYVGKIGPLHFRMKSATLSSIRQLALAFFLAIVGLRYGYGTLNSLAGSGAYLVLVAFICSFLAIAVGFLLGRFGFKLNWILLAGAICGGMTSTPGLGAAIDATGSDEAAAGYGAVYPFALLGMIIFAILLYRLPLG